MTCGYRGNVYSRWFCVFHDDRTDVLRLFDPSIWLVMR
jgi:hypothetical protein